MKLGLPFSITVLFWMIVGMVRQLYETKFKKRIYVNQKVIEKKLKKVAICIPAHNEEKVLGKTLKSVKRLVSAKQIYVVSDGSSDRTAKIAQAEHVNMLELMPGRGKAKALVALFKHFKLLQRHKFILFVDADAVINSQYLKRALRIFEADPKTAAIAGYAINRFRNHRKILTKKNFIVAYRHRLSYLLQLFLVYGYTSSFMNAAMVIPGSCSIYRTKALKKLRLDTPGILIEDFNLAFQIYKKRLGKIRHYPSIYSFDVEPTSIKDYFKQVKRWNIGFLQTVRKNGIWPSLFWLSTGLFSLEVWINALVILLLPVVVTVLTIMLYMELMRFQSLLGDHKIWQYSVLAWEILLSIFLLDYAMTLFTLVKKKKSILAAYGLGFLFFRFLDAVILFSSIPQGLFSKSKGSWIPPKR